MKQVEINGLLWDVENIDDKYYTFDEARQKAKNCGKRLPTKEEYDALTKLGSTWDEKLKGRWFGVDSNLMEISTQSIFLPASGNRNPINDRPCNLRCYGYYWSSSPYSTMNGYSMYFYSGGVSLSYSNHLVNAFPVRCVQDISKSPTTKTLRKCLTNISDKDILKWLQSRCSVETGLCAAYCENDFPNNKDIPCIIVGFMIEDQLAVIQITNSATKEFKVVAFSDLFLDLSFSFTTQK